MGNQAYTVANFGVNAEQKVLAAWKMCYIRHAQQRSRMSATATGFFASIPVTSYYNIETIVNLFSPYPIGGLGLLQATFAWGLLATTVRCACETYNAGTNCGFYEAFEKKLITIHREVRRGSFHVESYNRLMDEINLYSLTNPHRATWWYFDEKKAEKRFDREMACYHPEIAKVSEEKK